MNGSTRETLLKAALVVFGVIFFLVYPLGLVWPSGWVWHGGEGKYYFQMICGIYAVLGAFLINAARNPSEHRSLIWFPSGRASCMPLSWQASRSLMRTRWVICWVMCPLSCWSLWCSGCCCHPNKRTSSQPKTPTSGVAQIFGERPIATPVAASFKAQPVRGDPTSDCSAQPSGSSPVAAVALLVSKNAAITHTALYSRSAIRRNPYPTAPLFKVSSSFGANFFLFLLPAAHPH